MSDSSVRVKAVAAIRRARDTAFARRDWETARERDRELVITTNDEVLFHELYFGTPSPEFRAQLLKAVGKNEAPRAYTRAFFGGGRVLDLASGELEGNGSLVVGGTFHRLLLALCSDFYQPLGLSALHAAVFPGKPFDSRTSRAKVQRIVGGLRRWLDRKCFPLEIIENQNRFRLVPSAPCSIRVEA